MLITPRMDARTVPDWFVRRLRETDPALLCYWNPLRQRWVIDRCTKGDHTHEIGCPRTTVKLVQGDRGEYRDLSDSVIDDIRATDMWLKYGSLEKVLAAQNQELAEDQAERERQTRSNFRDIASDPLWVRVVGKPIEQVFAKDWEAGVPVCPQCSVENHEEHTGADIVHGQIHVCDCLLCEQPDNDRKERSRLRRLIQTSAPTGGLQEQQ